MNTVYHHVQPSFIGQYEYEYEYECAFRIWAYVLDCSVNIMQSAALTYGQLWANPKLR